MDELSRLLELQSGVVSRQQVIACGSQPHDIRRLLRRREWALVHPGVYVDHTGPLTWLQRAWAATLSVAPSALSHESALRAADGPGHRAHLDDDPIHVAVDRHRKVVFPSGVRGHRVSGLASKALWNTSPPRIRTEEAVLDVAADARDPLGAIAVLADAVQARRTTATRIASALESRERIARRALLTAVVHDLAEGACSALEHGYLTRVERAHGLPRAARQVRASARGPVYRDVEYGALGLVVELDGRLFHDSAAARDRDLDRDLEAALSGRQTVRLGWGQVFGRPCDTAVRIGRLLQLRGWTGSPRSCAHCTVRSIRATG